MPRLAFTANLFRHLPVPDMEVDGATVREALDAAFQRLPALKGYLLDDQGEVRKHMAVFVDGQFLRDRARLSDPVRESSEIFVMQALSGG